jgi:hypothetical protein
MPLEPCSVDNFTFFSSTLVILCAPICNSLACFSESAYDDSCTVNYLRLLACVTVLEEQTRKDVSRIAEKKKFSKEKKTN